MQTEDHQSCPCNQVFNSISDKDCLQNTDKLLVVAGWPTSTLLVCSSVLSMFDDMSNIESLFIGNCENKKKYSLSFYHCIKWQTFVKHFPLLNLVFVFQNPEEKGETEEGADASKSEISLVYEIALKRNLSVNFEVRTIWEIPTRICSCNVIIIGTKGNCKLWSSLK